MKFDRSLLVLTATALLITGCAATESEQTQTAAPTAASSPSAATSAASAAPSTTATPSKSAVPKDTRTGSELNEPFTVQGIIVVSKKHRISASYKTTNPTGTYNLESNTAKALATLTAAAKADGVTIRVKSGYRSYATQKASYDRARRTQPQNLSYYAPPGASEHQTGLAVDLWDGKVWYSAMQYTAAGKWLHKHCHEYGFILRFPKSKTAITGVAYEPWHFRYVGVSVAKQFNADNSLSLEEYLGLA